MIRRTLALLGIRQPATQDAAAAARRIEVAQVAHYMATQAGVLRQAHDSSDAEQTFQQYQRMTQAGAAGAQAMADLLFAIVVGDKADFKRVLNEFVDDAHASGALI